MNISSANKNAECVVCRESASYLLFSHRHIEVMKCRICELVYVLPRNTQTTAASRNNGWGTGFNGSQYIDEVFVRRHSFWSDYWRRQLLRIEQLIDIQKPRLLDIGCGVGQFMLAAREFGWDPVGVEISKDQALYANRAFDLEVAADAFERVDFDPSSFDIVTLWSVLEHLRDPRFVMEKIRAILRPSGIVVIRTPNHESLISILAAATHKLTRGRYLLPIYSNDHLFRFSELSLRNLLTITGFETLRLGQDDNLGVMLARMHLNKYRNPRKFALSLIHPAARLVNRQNQLLVFGKPTTNFI